MNSIVYKSRFLSSIACMFTRVKNWKFPQEVERRGKLDIFDYKGVAQPLPKYYEEILTDNNSFGMGRVLRKYADIQSNHINSVVEHGYFFGEYVPIQEQLTFSKQILTFGDVRKAHIEDKIIGKTVIPIGPYIHYATFFYDEEKMIKMKEKMGKTLLVFFSHAATGCSVSFDVDYIISKIEEIRMDYKTVIVSIFWSDITPKLVSKLEKHHYIIFSAGHRYDYNFLARQKTIIALADMTMSNNIGTHIAYCTYMGKPHWIVKQEIEYSSSDEKGEGNMNVIRQIKTDISAAKEKEEIMKIFSNYSQTLSVEQISVASKYFGFSHIKDPEEMRIILTKI